MTVLIVQYEIRNDARPEFDDAVAELMAAVDAAAPAGVRYTLGTRPDGVTVVGLLELPDGADNPLPGIPEARRFQDGLARWVVGDPPVPVRLDLVGTSGWGG